VIKAQFMLADACVGGVLLLKNLTTSRGNAEQIIECTDYTKLLQKVRA
jgi:hypothetical protein